MYVFMKKRNKYFEVIWKIIASVVFVAFVGAEWWIG